MTTHEEKSAKRETFTARIVGDMMTVTSVRGETASGKLVAGLTDEWIKRELERTIKRARRARNEREQQEDEAA